MNIEIAFSTEHNIFDQNSNFVIINLHQYETAGAS